jgi:hypothetical protein
MTDPQIARYIEKLQDEDWNVRKHAVLTLGRTGDAAVVPALVGSLQDTFASVRASAAVELGKLGESTAVPGLIAALQDEEWIVRKYVVAALAKIGEPAAMLALLERLQDDQWNIRALVAMELGKRGEIASVPTLLQMLQFDDDSLRVEVAAVLTHLGVPAVASLIQALHTPSNHSMLAMALENMGDSHTLPRKILSESRLSARDRLFVLEKLRGLRYIKSGAIVRYTFPKTRTLCRIVLAEEDAEARAGARTVLNWLDGERHLVHASQPEVGSESQNLLRASPNETSDPQHETLLRRADEPENNTAPAPPHRSPWIRLFGKRKESTND